jgi:hypothetical protein
MDFGGFCPLGTIETSLTGFKAPQMHRFGAGKVHIPATGAILVYRNHDISEDKRNIVSQAAAMAGRQAGRMLFFRAILGACNRTRR